MNKDSLNNRIQAYKEVFASGEIQATHQRLVAELQRIRTEFHKTYKAEMSVASVMHGYIDFTYFYIQNDFLKKRKLKLAIVLNHQKVQFELWLLGQTKDTQRDYWHKLAATQWVNSSTMPEYAIFEVVIQKTPDFDNPQWLCESIHREFVSRFSEITETLNALDS